MSRLSNNSRVISSFVGVFPMSEPKYLILVVLDEPKGKNSAVSQNTGGWVAAPVVGNVIRRIGPMEGIAPMLDPILDASAPGTVVELDGDEIRLAAH